MACVREWADALLDYIRERGHHPGCDKSMYQGEQPCTCAYERVVKALEQHAKVAP